MSRHKVQQENFLIFHCWIQKFCHHDQICIMMLQYRLCSPQMSTFSRPLSMLNWMLINSAKLSFFPLFWKKVTSSAWLLQTDLAYSDFIFFMIQYRIISYIFFFMIVSNYSCPTTDRQSIHWKEKVKKTQLLVLLQSLLNW